MRPGRFLLTCAVLLCVAIAWNALVHLVVLQAANASVRHLRRADLADRAWLSLVLTAGIVVMFVAGYGRVATSGSVREGIGYGLFFAALAGLLVDLNQYVLFPIPGVRRPVCIVQGGVSHLRRRIHNRRTRTAKARQEVRRPVSDPFRAIAGHEHVTTGVP